MTKIMPKHIIIQVLKTSDKILKQPGERREKKKDNKILVKNKNARKKTVD